MSKLEKSLSICFIVMCTWKTVFAQVDSLDMKQAFPDSMDQLLEQASPVEDSPLPDLLSQESDGGILQPQLTIRSRIQQTLQKAAGYEKGTYHGSMVKSYHRIRVRGGDHLSAGILFEKDAGEKRFNDFTAGNLTITGIGPARKVILGDFIVEAGEGMALWRGYDLSKGADIISPVQRKERGLVPYLSSDEQNYLSGIAAEFEAGKNSTDIFYSLRSLSASIDSNNHVSGFYTAGYFRTDAEEGKRDDLQERMIGVRNTFHFDKQRIGFTAYKTVFSSGLVLEGERRFEGKEYSLAALDFAFDWFPVGLFGEWAFVNRTMGGISGLVLQPSPVMNLIASLRHYPANLVSLHGLGFGEKFPNEDGLYVGVHIHPRGMSLTLYYDQYRFPEPIPGLHFPSTGSDLFLQLEFIPASLFNVQLRCQRKVSGVRGFEAVDENGLPLLRVETQRTRRIRLDLEYAPSQQARLRTRFERAYFDQSSRQEKGLMIYQDIALKPTAQLRWDFRLVFFQSDSYDSRIYETEKELSGLLALPALYGRGIRWYARLTYQLLEQFEFSAKYSDLLRDDVKRIGSGLDELPGNHDNRIGVQFDLRF